MDIRNYVLGDNADFYPTPVTLANKMIEMVDWNKVRNILEPSAGKGDLVERILYNMNRKRSRGERWKIDVVESDPNLRAIFAHRFSAKGREEYYPDIYEKVEYKRHHGFASFQEKYGKEWNWSRVNNLDNYINNYKNVHIVHDDFLTYDPMERFDAIVMNPPFSNGDKHLLHAIHLASRFGGQIVCLLNAETIKNPYTMSRKELAKQMETYGAKVQYISDAFRKAERSTGVEIALVYMELPAAEYTSKIFERLEEAEAYKRNADPEYKALISSDPISAAVAMYKMEVAASIELIGEYKAMQAKSKQWLQENDAGTLTLCCSDSGNYHSLRINEYMRLVRRKYWRALFNSKSFTGLLTSNLTQEYQSMVNDLADYEFSEFNIRRIQKEMMAKMVDGVKATIMALFERMTVAHTYHREINNGNIHYYNGWKTNQAYKVGKRVVIPGYGLWDTWYGKLSRWETYKFLSDIEKALNYLGSDGVNTEVNLETIVDQAVANGQNRNIQCKYFNVTIYKKGTVHITFTDMELLDKFNIFASQHKGWLPPTYGRKAYNKMTQEEKEVIDSFQGEEEYNKVMSDPSRYIVSAQNLLALPVAG